MSVIARVYLRVLGQRTGLQTMGLGPALDLRSDVPRTRGDCEHGPRPCPHILCREHLWFIAASEHEAHPANPRGTPCRPARVLPRWLEYPTPPSCALDVSQSRPSTIKEIGHALGVHASYARRLVSEAKKHAAHEARSIPLDLDWDGAR